MSETGRHSEPCGCGIDERHTDTCPGSWVIAVADTELSYDPVADGVAAPITTLIDHPGVLNPTVIPQRAVLHVLPGRADPLAGLWQRQGDRLVPITPDTYSALVDSCWTGACGLCRMCQATAEHVKTRVDDQTTAAEAIATATRAVVHAQCLFDQLGVYDSGDDGIELTAQNARDAQAELAAAARAMRNAHRIVGPHVVRLLQDGVGDDD